MLTRYAIKPGTSILGLVLLLLVGCTGTTTPDLISLYDFQKPEHLNAAQPPVILVHGAFGSRLVNTEGEELWPGKLSRLLLGDYSDIQLQIDPKTLNPRADTLRVNGVTGSVAGRDYYQRLLSVLETVGRYQLTQVGTPPKLHQRRFVWSLTVPAPDLIIRPVVFGGDCHLTPARLLVEEVGGKSLVRMYPKEILNPMPGVNYERILLEPGDGTVTKASLLARPDLDPTIARHKYSYFPLRNNMFLCEKHAQLTGNINFQDNLMHVLLSADESG